MRSLRLTLLVVITALSAVAAQAQDRNAAIMKKLFSKLTQSFTVTPNDVKPGQSFLVLFNPGVFVDPNLDITKAADRQVIARLLNIVPTASWVVAGDSGKTVDEVYGLALKYGEWGYVDPTPNQVKALETARKLLYLHGDPADGYSQAYQTYQAKQTAYTTARDAYEAKRIDKENGVIKTIPPALKTARDQAQKAWETVGRKNEIESALAQEFSLTATTGNWFFDMRERMNGFKETVEGTEFWTTPTYPQYKEWFSDQGWQAVSFVESEIEKQSESNRVSYGGGGSAGWGLWHVSASASHTQADSRFESNVKNLAIAMQVKRVLIQRPWLSQLLFESPRWRFGKNAPAETSGGISDGQATADKLPGGMMPLYATGLLIARNVEITGEEGSDLQTSFESHTSGGASVGWGPFAVSGHYSEDKSRSYSKAVKIANGIKASEPQIIGLFCLVLGKTPNPTNDPNVKWLSDPEPQ